MTPLEKNEANEKFLLIYAYTDGAVIDRATQAGVTAGHFLKPEHYHQWQFLCELRLRGLGTDGGTVIQEAIAAGRIDAMGGVPHVFQCSEIGNASPGGAGPCIERILDVHAKRQAYKLLLGAVEHLTDGGGELSTVRETVERVAGICAGNGSVSRGIPEIADEAIKDAEEQIKGEKASRTLIYTGLPTFDRYATPMEAHEYCVVGARTSHGKSSFLLQVAGHNLAQGKRVAIFSLETSDKAVLKQIVGQRAQVNIRQFHAELPAKQQDYLEKLRFAKATKDLLIFDKDLSLSAIEARCRLLATSFKPNLVIVDYLGLVGIEGSSSYERMSKVSKSMIALKKAIGCTLMVGAQLNRGPEKEEREPGRSDFRDAGGIEEDAHRIIALWRKPGQPLDCDYYDSALLQLKCRDGGLTKVECSFHGPTTRFLEQTNRN
jgi:replicative DNA helicase